MNYIIIAMWAYGWQGSILIGNMKLIIVLLYIYIYIYLPSYPILYRDIDQLFNLSIKLIQTQLVDYILLLKIIL